MESKGLMSAVVVVVLLVGIGIGYFIPGIINPPPTTTAPTSSTTTTTTEPDLLEVIQSRGYMIVGTSSGWPPFEMVNTTDSTLYGFDIDLANYVASELGVTIQWTDMDFDALVSACSAGTIDMIAAATFITPDRNDVLLPTVWYIRTNEVVAVKSSTDITVNSLADLNGLDVGVQTGTVEADEIDAFNNDTGTILVHYYPRPDTMFADLNAGTLDAVYVDEPVLTVYSDVYPLKGVYTVTAPPTAFYVNYGNPEFYKAVNNAITKAFETGALDAMVAKWFG